MKTSFEIRWIYPRPNGDIEVWAETAEKAALSLRAHGFTTVEASKLKRGRMSAPIPQPPIISADYEKVSK